MKRQVKAQSLWERFPVKSAVGALPVRFRSECGRNGFKFPENGFRNGARVLFAVLSGICMFSALPVQAAKRRPIRAITLSFETDNIRPEVDYDESEISIEASGDQFYVEEYEVLNRGFYWDVDSVPEIGITMTAADGYYFGAIAEDKLRLIGGGAVYLSGVRRDSGQTLEMRVKLAPVSLSISDLETVQLATDGTASWQAVSTAGSYEVKVYRDGKRTGSSMVVEGTACDCSLRMKKRGSYQVKVRPINAVDSSITGGWTLSGTIQVDEAAAAANRARAEATEQAEKQAAAGETACAGEQNT